MLAKYVTRAGSAWVTIEIMLFCGLQGGDTFNDFKTVGRYQQSF